MKNKKVWVGFVAVFITVAVFGITKYWIGTENIINTLFFSTFESISHLVRPEEEQKIWAVVISWAFFAYFFTWIFSKGYERKGIMEGVRYGLAVAFMMQIPWAYGSYAMLKDFPYSITLWWSLYVTVEYVIYGIVLAWIFGMKPKQVATS